MSDLTGCLPALIAAHDKLVAKAAAVGITFKIADYGGLRSPAVVAMLIKWRDEAVAKAGRKAYYAVAPYKRGYHPRGAAFDAEILTRPANMSEPAALATLGQLAASCGLRWGGTFPHPDTDIYHFELAESLALATAEYAAFSGVTVPLV